ncbi:MAG: deoxycytidine triphosphate deaminase [Cycloclasticus sp.]|nr:MAG: deoxycytidine triphosphate deaminase [Cycloclasticus sp.]
MDKQTQLEIEAAAFRRIIKHFQTHTDVQNIDLMNLADFCRNCFSKWYMAEAKEKGVEMDYDAAREVVYGMPFSEFKQKYQKPATAEQLAAFEVGEERRKRQGD